MIVFVEINPLTSDIDVRVADGGVPENTFTSTFIMQNGHPNIILWLTGEPHSEEIKAKAEHAVSEFVTKLMLPYWKGSKYPYRY